MHILNITYVVAESKVALWKKWLKEDALSKSVAVSTPSYRVYKINHVAEPGQVSFSVQFDFEDLAFLDLFETELDHAHANSLGPLLGAQCLFFSTVLSKEEL